jgi:pimeloyl-ACP methyl ester carboxylesterase
LSARGGAGGFDPSSSARRISAMPVTRIILVLVLALLGSCAGRSVAAFDQALLLPPGRYVNLDTHRLYYECAGSGTPVVLLDYGIGGSVLGWRSLQRDLARDTTVCAYDRAGYGWSDPGPSPRTTHQAVQELRQLVELAGIAAPFVLVGHSFGGFDTRYFAVRHPQDVAGLVWIDSSHPDEALVLPEQRPGAMLLNPIAPDARARDADSDETAAAAYLNTRRKAIFAQMDELANFRQSAQQVATAGALPNVPLIVLARDDAADASRATAERRWREHQAGLARLTPQGQLWLATGSGHDIHRDRPDLVLAAVREILETVRARQNALVKPALPAPPPSRSHRYHAQRPPRDSAP